MHTARWTNHSRRLRKQSPCEQCGSTQRLSVNHILPASEFPEYFWHTENHQVLCLRHNQQRGNTYTAADVALVQARIAALKRKTHAL